MADSEAETAAEAPKPLFKALLEKRFTELETEAVKGGDGDDDAAALAAADLPAESLRIAVGANAGDDDGGAGGGSGDPAALGLATHAEPDEWMPPGHLEGWLEKQGRLFRGWKRRYLKQDGIKGGMLTYV